MRILRADLARLCALVWLVVALAMPYGMVRAQAQASLDVLLADICRGDPSKTQAPDGGQDRPVHHYGLACCLHGQRILPALPVSAFNDAVPVPRPMDGRPHVWMPPPQALPRPPPPWRPQSPRAPPYLT